MSLYKIGSSLKILKTASSATDVLVDGPISEKVPNSSKIIEPKHSDFLYYRARAISAGDQGPLGKDGKRSWAYNGNFDYFPRKELEAAYPTFISRNIFLDHQSESSLYSIGKIIDAVPVDDQETGEFYIELVGKIDRTLHPEIARKIETGELNSTSMGCSVDDSMCSICGNILHSDGDDKCVHMGMNLGKKFPAEIDLPEYNIRKGEMVPCFSINSGIVFNEDSIVGVPADPTAVIKTVLSNMKSRLTKKASLSKEEQLDLAAQMEKLFEKLDDTTKLSLKTEFCGICPPVNKEAATHSCECGHAQRVHVNDDGKCEGKDCNCKKFDDYTKESSMADKNVLPNEDQKKILSKLSALEMEQLESYVAHKTKKANEIVNKEVVADAASKEETFLSKIVAKVKNSFAAELLEKKIETVAKEELGKEDKKHDPKLVEDAKKQEIAIEEAEKEMKKMKKMKSSISATFTEDKNNVLDSTWSVNDGDKEVLNASLKDIWGAQFALLSFDDQKWATSEAYGKEVVSRYTKEGLAKLADLWDVTHKINKTAEDEKFVKCPDCKTSLIHQKHFDHYSTGECPNCGQIKEYKVSSKTASEPKLGPSGPRVKPTTGTDNKEHDVKNSPVTKPGQETAQKGPAAPAHEDMKTDPKFKMPGQEKGQTGPAAPKPMAVKTDYSEPKPEAEGKEVKTTPKNPDEKDAKKSEKEVKTDYVAEGTEAMEAEEKGKKEASKKPVNYKEANAQIKWSALSPEAQEFIKKHVEKHIKEDGMERAQAVAAAYSEARKKGFEVPSKASSQEIIMEKKAENTTGKPEEAVQDKPELSKKTVGDKAMQSAQGETEPKGTDPKKAVDEAVKKEASDKPTESVDGSTLPEGKKKFDAKPDEAVKGTTLPEEGKASAPETSAQGDKEHKTPNLTKAPDQAVDGNTIPHGKKDEESVETSTHPDGKKSMGTEPDMAVNKKANAPCEGCGKALEQNKVPGDFCGDCLAKNLSNKRTPMDKKPTPLPELEMAAATEMPTPEDHPAIEEKMKEHVEMKGLEPKPMDMPKGKEVSAFDATEKLDIGEGYSAHKDHESKEIIIEKDGKEVKRLPDGFGADAAMVLTLMKAVLGLPAEEAKPTMSPDIMAPKMDEHKEEPKTEEHPALEEAHEDELGIKESALKVKEAELIKKEAALKAKEDAVAKEEATKKFASVLQARSERCRKIVSELVEKEQLSYDKNVYESELKNGAHLLDARKKAFEAAITAKQKEFLSLNDDSLTVMEATVASIKAPITPVKKNASRLFVSPQYNEQMSEEAEIKQIFDTMGNSKKHPQ